MFYYSGTIAELMDVLDRLVAIEAGARIEDNKLLKPIV